MKHIKIFYLLSLIYFPLQSAPNEDIENYFTEIYENEKLKFLECVGGESLSPVDEVNKKCKISSLAKDAAYFLFENKKLNRYDFLGYSEQYVPLYKPKLKYPQNASSRGIEGYAIIKFDLSLKGETLNLEIVEGKCGNIRNPFTKFEDCNIFNFSAFNAARKLKYKPTEFEGKAIETKGLLHKFSFIMEDETLSIRKKKNKEYKQVVRAIKNNEFKKAIEISEANIKHDYIFMQLIASAEYQKGNYIEAKDWLNKFKAELIKEGRYLPENILVISYSTLISSLFNLGQYAQIIELEDEFGRYIKDRRKYDDLLVITNFYFGASYINVGNINKGAYYLGLAAKKSKSKVQSDYIDSVISQISSYL